MMITGRGQNGLRWYCFGALLQIITVTLGIIAGYFLGQPAGKPAAVEAPTTTEVPLIEPSGGGQTAAVQAEADVEIPFDELGVKIEHAICEPGLALREQALFRIRRGMRLADLPRALELLATNRAPEVAAIRVYLAGRWAEFDPLAAFSWAHGLSKSPLRDKLLTSVLAEWTVSDPIGALREVNALPSDQEKEAAWAAVLDTMAAQDPQRAMGQLDRLDTSAKRDLQALILHHWAAKAPAAAAAAAGKTEGVQTSVYADIASQWATRDAYAAIGWAKTLAPALVHDAAVEGLVTAWAAYDPARAAAFALSQPPRDIRGRLLDSVAGQWALADPQSAAVWAHDLSVESERGRASARIAAVWADADPQAATRYALQSLKGQCQLEALDSVGAVWVKRDPEGAIEWELSLPMSVRAEVASHTIKLLSKEDPESVANLVMSLNTKDQSSFTEDLAADWARQDLQGAIAWLHQLSPGSMRDSALAGLLGEWARNDPQQASDYILRDSSIRIDSVFSFASAWGQDRPEEAVKWAESLPDGSRKNFVLRSLAQGWASVSPAEAAVYAVQIPDIPTKEAAVTGIAGQWADTDPGSAASWVESFPDGNLRRKAIVNVAKSWASQDAADAVAWCQSVCDVTQLGSDVNILLSYWFNQDPERAQAWLQNSPLPESTKMPWLRRRSGQ